MCSSGSVLRSGNSSCRTRPLTCNTRDRKSTRLNSSHSQISYAVFCLKNNHHGDSWELEENYLLADDLQPGSIYLVHMSINFEFQPRPTANSIHTSVGLKAIIPDHQHY